jgi:predicted amidohydrolase YtcJ
MSRELAAAGVTAFTDATVRNSAQELGLFEQAVKSGAITQSVGVMIGADHFEEAREALTGAGGATSVRMAGVKFMTGARFDVERASQVALLARRGGLDCAFHATEVDELEQALAVIRAARAGGGEGELRIEHGGLIPPNYVAQIAAEDAWVVTNPGFIHFRGAKYADDPGLAPHLYRAASLKRAGIRLAGATDAPVTPARPLAAIAAAASRTTLDGVELAPEERLGLDDAIGLFTRDAAQLGRLAAGSIEPGMRADLAVLPRDPLTMEPAELHNVAVDVTIIGGRVVYERGRPAIAHSDSAELLSS